MPGPFGQPEEDEDPLLALQHHMGVRDPAPPAQRAYAPAPSAEHEQGLRDSARTFYDPSFVNAGRYLDANKGQGERMAHAVSGSVAGKGKTAAGHISGAVSTFGQNVNGDKPAFTYAPDTSSPSSGDRSGDLSGGTGTSPYAYARPTGNVTPAAPSVPGAPATSSTSTGPYAGSESLLDDHPELVDEAKTAATEANQLGDDVSRRQSMRDFYGKGAGYYGTSGAGLDSFLAGAEGHSELAQVQKEYGGLEDVLTKANDTSIADVASRRGRDATAAAEAARIAAERKAALEKDRAAKLAEDEKGAAYAKEREGKESYEDYTTGHNSEHTIQDIGRFLNPVYGISDALGLPSIEGERTDYYEDTVNKATGSHRNARALQLDRLMPGTSPAMQRAVYDILTTAELRQLEHWGKPMQHDYLMLRLAEVQKKARETLQHQGL